MGVAAFTVVRAALLVALAITVTGCMTTKYAWLEYDLEEKATTAIDNYARDLRWGRVPNAARAVEPLKRPEFVAFFREGHPFRFTDSIVDGINFNPKDRVATAMVRYTLYRTPGITELQVAEIQQWRYDRETSAWYIDPDLEIFRSAGRRY